MSAVDAGRTVQVHNTATQEQEPRTHHIHHDIHDKYICQMFDSQNVNSSASENTFLESMKPWKI